MDFEWIKRIIQYGVRRNAEIHWVFVPHLPSIRWLDSHEPVASIPLNKSLGILARKIRIIPYLYPLKFEHDL